MSAPLYFLIFLGIWGLIVVFISSLRGGPPDRSIPRRVTEKLDQSVPEKLVVVHPEPPPATLLVRFADATEKMQKTSKAKLDDTLFEISYCKWFQNFKIHVDSELKFSRFWIDHLELLERDPRLRTFYEKLNGSIPTLENLLKAERELEKDTDIREPLLHGTLPPPPPDEGQSLGSRRFAIYQRRLSEHDEYLRTVKRELTGNESLSKLFFARVQKLPEATYILDAFARHQTFPDSMTPPPKRSHLMPFSPQVVQIERSESNNRASHQSISTPSSGSILRRARAGNEILTCLSNHKVEKALHFTRAENLGSILKHGILPISALVDKGLNALVNDKERRDSKLNSVSLSLSFPNQLMLYKYQRIAQEADWIIFEIPVETLAFKRIAFYATNAAHHKMRHLDISNLSTESAIDSLFDEVRLKRPAYLRDCDPTDVQAEVMLFGTVAPSDIVRIIFETEGAAKRCSHLTGSFNIAVDGRGCGYFGTRENFLK